MILLSELARLSDECRQSLLQESVQSVQTKIADCRSVALRAVDEEVHRYVFDGDYVRQRTDQIQGGMHSAKGFSVFYALDRSETSDTRC